MPISTEEDMKNREPVIRPKTIYIPAYIFQEFTEVTVENEEFFSYISFYVVMQMIEKVVDLNWVV